ncbi:MAG TPA: Crp/Fnr family transcriptional regulator [Alphaproteobacteria bacterium]|nr:Crp/Fnr family transcriptional regulator [Alphaproteobacteria bacterium]
MNQALRLKLERFTHFSQQDNDLIARLCTDRVREFAAGTDIVSERADAKFINIMLDGWAWRCRYLEDGRRQILALLLAGDVFDLHNLVLRRADHTVHAVTAVTIAQIPVEPIREIICSNSRLGLALQWQEATNIAIQREWTVNLGQRDAFERIAHLLCEVFVRLRLIGQVRGDSCDWPLTQSDLADIAGISAVHVNRVLRDIRLANLADIKGRVLTIPNLERLMEASQFDLTYLHLYLEEDRVGLSER